MLNTKIYSYLFGCLLCTHLLQWFCNGVVLVYLDAIPGTLGIRFEYTLICQYERKEGRKVGRPELGSLSVRCSTTCTYVTFAVAVNEDLNVFVNDAP